MLEEDVQVPITMLCDYVETGKEGHDILLIDNPSQNGIDLSARSRACCGTATIYFLKATGTGYILVLELHIRNISFVIKGDYLGFIKMFCK